MRAVIQRVNRAAVSVDGQVVGAIDRPGLLVLVGATHDDGAAQVALIARKIADLRLLEGELSVTDAAAPVLVVSQFTLYADTRKGRRPSWNQAAGADVANRWCRLWLRICARGGLRWPRASLGPTW